MSPIPISKPFPILFLNRLSSPSGESMLCKKKCCWSSFIMPPNFSAVTLGIWEVSYVLWLAYPGVRVQRLIFNGTRLNLSNILKYLYFYLYFIYFCLAFWHLSGCILSEVVTITTISTISSQHGTDRGRLISVVMS